VRVHGDRQAGGMRGVDDHAQLVQGELAARDVGAGPARRPDAPRGRPAGLRRGQRHHSGKPHGVLPAAVAQLAEGGVPADAALATATSLVADACGLADRKGRVRRGFDADPLLSGGDPFTDPAALSCPVAVLAAALWASTDPRSGPE
jgi:predicted amidohydrolase YtcJ